MFEELSKAFASDPDWISYIKATKEKLNEGRITPRSFSPGGVRMRIKKDRVMVSRMNGKRVGGEQQNEADHFYKCPARGQAMGMRDLGEVFHHELPGHEPLPVQ